MLYEKDLASKILTGPAYINSADELRIVVGHASPMMASWHINQLKELKLKHVKVKLVIGMCATEGLSIRAHNDFKSLVTNSDDMFQCQYVYQGQPVHSKIYSWLKNGDPVIAYTGSADYLQVALLRKRKEVMTECNPHQALAYFDNVEKNSIYCMCSEAEEQVVMHAAHPLLEDEDVDLDAIKGDGVQKISLSLLSRTGDVGKISGLNWGQRKGRDKNQAYISVPARIAKSDFFPKNKQHFSVITDDGKQLIFRLQQQDNKAMTTPMNNALIGQYIRYRLGLPDGSYVSREDLEKYGRLDVTFYKLDEEQFVMDFSV